MTKFILAATATLAILAFGCNPTDHGNPEDVDCCTAEQPSFAIDCSKVPMPAGCLEEDPPEPDAGTPPPAPVYVSYRITNAASVRRFCDVTMVTSSNPTASGAYYYYYLEVGQAYGGYHVNGGPPPYPVQFRVGCWPERETPVEQRVYTVVGFTLNTSTRFLFRNTDTGVVFDGSEQTL